MTEKKNKKPVYKKRTTTAKKKTGSTTKKSASSTQKSASRSRAMEQGEEWVQSRKRETKETNKKHKALRIASIVVCVVAVLALLVVAGGMMIIRHYYGLTNHVKDDDVSTMDFSNADEMFKDDQDAFYSREDVTDENGNVIGTTYETIDMDNLSDEERASIEASIAAEMSAAADQASAAQEVPIVSSGDVYNLLLIGVDLRAGQNWNGNSDTMILVSINSSKKQIYLTSFMRDLYANIPGVGTYKLNRSYALGGGPLLVQTIEENYRIKIDNYAWVDFYAMIDIIDALGGINLEVSAEEARVANNYIKEMCRGIGLDPSSYYISGGGTIHLNGMQAVAYARIRYVGNADFGRTERQRKVLSQMFTVLQSKSISEINAFLNTVLPKVTHNISADRVTNLILNAPSYLGYSLNSQRVPFDGAYSYVGEMLMPDFQYTIDMLRNTIY